MRRAALLLALVMATTTPVDAEFPYDVDGKQAAVWGGGLASLGGGALLGDNVDPLTPAEIAALDVSTILGLDRSAARRWSLGAAKGSDILAGTLMVAPLLLLADDTGGKEPWTLGGLYVQTMLLEQGTVYLLKQLTARTRPFVYNDDPAIPADLKASRFARRSFPSGHTAEAFAAATFVGTVFERLNPDSPARGWVWGGVLSAAAATGYLRYRAGRHYPTDILVGAVLGSAIGTLVPRWFEKDDDPDGAGVVPQLVFGFGF